MRIFLTDCLRAWVEVLAGLLVVALIISAFAWLFTTASHNPHLATVLNWAVGTGACALYGGMFIWWAVQQAMRTRDHWRECRYLTQLRAIDHERYLREMERRRNR